MDWKEIEERWEKYQLDTWDKRDVNWILSRVKELEAEVEELKEQLAFANRPGIRRSHGPLKI